MTVAELARIGAPAVVPAAVMVGIHLRRYGPAYACTPAIRRRLYQGARRRPDRYRGLRRAGAR